MVNSKLATTTKRQGNHIPRPRNAFFIFRCDFMKGSPDTARYRPTTQIGSQMSSLSKVAGAIWQKMSEEEKDSWRLKADIERQLHKEKYPDYVYKPKPRKGSNEGTAQALRSLHEDVLCLSSPGSSIASGHDEHAGNIITDRSTVSPDGTRTTSPDVSVGNQPSYMLQDSEVPHYAMSLPLYHASDSVLWDQTSSNWSCHNYYTRRFEPNDNDNLATTSVSRSSPMSTDADPSQLPLNGLFYRDPYAYDNSPYGNVNTVLDSGVGEFLGPLPPSDVEKWWDEVLGHRI